MTEPDTAGAGTPSAGTPSSGAGLLGSITEALSSFDADATPVTRLRPNDGLSADAAGPTEPPDTEARAADQPRQTTGDTAADPTASPWGSSATAAVQRPIDASARALAQRLLAATGNGATAPVDAACADDGTFVIIESDSGIERPIGQRLIIGRAGHGTGDQLVVDLAVVSRRHCELVREGAGVVISDLGAANGTYVVRGADVLQIGSEPTELHDGDIVATAAGQRSIAEFRVRPSGGTS